ncbi:glutathione S-transferase family protein [uncultured Paraglaciecola sp.]|uniref:glutathione S-transferase family protein n=1 Tax=uncultured Paraglaciecola sp. TaxID=1765024 RepID=UPI00259ACBDA|nr:glutathione S-transferase family protein [uncultured Paraglaciecola sp.]
MSHTLILGNKNYSSWSMRAWLLLEFLEIPYSEERIDLYTSDSRKRVMALGGETGLVPVLKVDDFAIWDTLAIIEYLHEDFPKIWPIERNLRARARSICGEVSSGLTHLRNAMPVNTRGRFKLTHLSAEVEADISRVVQIWEARLLEHEGPWLFGEFCAADIIFAPVATRFRTYGVELSGAAKAYQEQILSHPLVLKWLALGKDEKTFIPLFEEQLAPYKIN